MAIQAADFFKELISHCKEYGYIFPSSEIYDGLSAVYDYGPYGAELKNNLRQYWWKAMVQMHENIVGIDAAIFMHPKTWKASGHVDAFNDPMVDNKVSKKRYRADQLIEGWMDKLDEKVAKEVEKAATRFGEQFDAEMYRQTNPRVAEYLAKRNAVNERFQKAMADKNMAGLKALIDECEIVDPESGSRDWTEVRQFNLMFSTQMGSVAEDANTIYLRPETAQGIFVNFLNVQKTTRQKLPFGIAQTGKAFRNEIVARQFIFRMREFEQMEMQFFVKPGEEMKYYEYWKATRMNWHLTLFPAAKLRYHDHENLAHYANAAVDVEFQFPFGFKELEGIHSRTNFDLTEHQKLSGKKLQYFDPELNESYVPYVVETSVGLDRLFLAMMTYALREEQVQDAQGEAATRTVLGLPPALAPIKAAILPLVKTDAGLTDKARSIFDQLKYAFPCQYDEKDAVGRRYRRQDAIGTPFCITVDGDSLLDNSVTVRERDTMKQERVAISALESLIREKTDMSVLLRHLHA